MENEMIVMGSHEWSPFTRKSAIALCADDSSAVNGTMSLPLYFFSVSKLISFAHNVTLYIGTNRSVYI